MTLTLLAFVPAVQQRCYQLSKSCVKSSGVGGDARSVKETEAIRNKLN